MCAEVTKKSLQSIDYTDKVIVQARAKAFALLLKWREEDKLLSGDITNGSVTASTKEG